MALRYFHDLHVGALLDLGDEAGAPKGDGRQDGDHPCHHDRGERDLEAKTCDPERMRLMIQIPVFLKVLISCFLGSELVWLSEWASQPSWTPRNHNPSGWRTEGRFAGLAKGMPNVSSTGLKGERS